MDVFSLNLIIFRVLIPNFSVLLSKNTDHTLILTLGNILRYISQTTFGQLLKKSMKI